MVAFEGSEPEYHIELRERPTMVWDFHILLPAIQMMFSFMLVDETATLDSGILPSGRTEKLLFRVDKCQL